MATELLHCCICPKRPNFSDTSHLLTHVSSKGHLSHLHKLQVRSHQEISAVQQLSVYNQWFTQHNVAHLLSERMQQKEQKQARRKVENRYRQHPPKQESHLNVDPNLQSGISDPPSHQLGYGMKDDSIYDGSSHMSSYTPTRMSRSNQLQSVSLVRSTKEPMWSHSADGSSDLTPPATGVTTGGTPDMTKLKGTIWPGMDMFDSADQETQRKRNQRKDVSVLERMQAMSKLVQPLETICSPGGTMKKQRHMDHLEDDSPVEGESPIAKQSSKRKRKPLGSLSVNRGRKRTLKTRRTANHLTNSSTPTRTRPSNATYKYRSRFDLASLTNDIGTEQIPTVTPVHWRRQPDFEIFDDHIFDLSVDYTACLVSNSYNNEKKHDDVVQPLVFPPATWLQPMTQRHHIYDPFRDYRSARVAPYMHTDFETGKENENPLMWQKDSTKVASTLTPGFHDNFDDFDETFGTLADVYAFTKNPLIGNTPKPSVLDRTPCRSTLKNRALDRKMVNYR